MIVYVLKWKDSETGKEYTETYNIDKIEEMMNHKRRGQPRISEAEGNDPNLFGKAIIDYFNSSLINNGKKRIFVSCVQEERPDPKPTVDPDRQRDLDEDLDYDEDDNDDNDDYLDHYFDDEEDY